MLEKYNITGKRFGRLVAISFVRATTKGRFWLCRCDCGGEKTARSDTLASGNTSSCGCAWREKIAESNRLSIAGKRYGKLIAVSSTGTTKRMSVLWLCECDCGGSRLATVSKLQSGRVISCGCAAADSLVYMPLKARAQAAADFSKRRARKLSAGGEFTADQINELYLKQRGKCACCRAKLGGKFHRDHKIPLTRGGSNDILNIELLCAPCNLAKQDMDPIDWAQKRGMLC